MQLGLRLRLWYGEGGRQRKAPPLQPSSDLEGSFSAKIWEITLSYKEIKKKKKSSPNTLPDRKWSLFERKRKTTHSGGRFVVSCPEDYLLMLWYVLSQSFHDAVFQITPPPAPPSQCNTSQLFWGNMLALEWVRQTVNELPTCSKEAEWPFVAPSSHVHSGRKLRWEPVCLPIYLLGKHLRRLHLIWTKWWQNVVRYLQELWWWPQVGLLSRPRYKNSVCGYFPLQC